MGKLQIGKPKCINYLCLHSKLLIMKTKTNHFTWLLLAFIIIACGNPAKQNPSTHTTALTGNDTTIVIGSYEGSTAAFVADSSTLKSDWQTFIDHIADYQGATLDKIEIINKAPNFYLEVTGYANSKRLRALMPLKLFDETCLYVTGTTITCTTNDCASEEQGCVPWGSTACTKCANDGKCTKTVSNSPTIIFPSIATSTCVN